MSSLQGLQTSLQNHIFYLRDYLLARLPKDRNSRLILAGSSAGIAGVVLYPLLYHSILGRQVHHTHPNASARFAALECGEIASLPKEIVENANQYRILHDKVTKVTTVTHTLSPKLEREFTECIRFQVERFAVAPQSWLLWLSMSSPLQKATFTKDHISSLKFVEGDVFCGIYEVVKRTPLRCEIAIRQPGDFAAIHGLIVISLRPRNSGSVLSNETIVWVSKASGKKMPLENWFFKFLHERTARQLVVGGAKYLKEVNDAGEV